MRMRPQYLVAGGIVAVFALSSVLGPLAGGYITSLFGWRWVFLVNLPIGIVVLAILAFAMRSRFNEKRHRIDYLGAGLNIVLMNFANHRGKRQIQLVVATIDENAF